MNDAARTQGANTKSAKGASEASREGFFARIVTFFKQVLGEFKKVQRPTRKELWSMFLTVLAFLIVVMIFVFALDLIFSKGMFWIFG